MSVGQLIHQHSFSSLRRNNSCSSSSTFTYPNVLPPFDERLEGLETFTIKKFPKINSMSEDNAGFQADSIHGEIVDDADTKDGNRFSTESLTLYDLRPPPPTVSDSNAEYLSERLYSVDHLAILVMDSNLLQRFTNFLHDYRPKCIPALMRYLESQKALTAIKYANSITAKISPQSDKTNEAAVINSDFQKFSQEAVEELLSNALPAYITYQLVNVVTECLVKEITGGNTPLMQDLVQGLAEVFCLTDPSLPDEPIIFASEDFYTSTQYGREYVIGKNCRFLQGPKTQKKAVKRVAQAVKDGHEISEVILNYRRDGTPYLNLLTMTPLMDHRGKVRYHLGSQVDVSHLIEGGRGLESFKRLLSKDREIKSAVPDPVTHKISFKLLRQFGCLLSDDEFDIVRERDSRRNSLNSSTSAPRAYVLPRRFVGLQESLDDRFDPSSDQPLPAGRLPGVYQNYLLVRPYPSLRIIFTSAALRIPGLSQSKLMDRIGGPQHIRDGLIDALAEGYGVTAKISWLTQCPRENGNGIPPYVPEDDSISIADEPLLDGKPRWIHCTPLIGSDNKVGVIMIVMVNREEITGALNHSSAFPTNRPPRRARSRPTSLSGDYTKEGWLLHGMAVNGATSRYTGSSKLYAEYLHRESRNGHATTNLNARAGCRSTCIDQLINPRTSSLKECFSRTAVATNANNTRLAHSPSMSLTESPSLNNSRPMTPRQCVTPVPPLSESTEVTGEEREWSRMGSWKGSTTLSGASSPMPSSSERVGSPGSRNLQKRGSGRLRKLTERGPW